MCLFVCLFVCFGFNEYMTSNKQGYILYLPLLITGHVFIKTKTNKNIKANAKQK